MRNTVSNGSATNGVTHVVLKETATPTGADQVSTGSRTFEGSAKDPGVFGVLQ